MAKKSKAAPADDMIQFRIPARLKAEYQLHVDARNETLSGWINGAMADRFNRERMYARVSGLRQEFQAEMRASGAKVVKAE